MKKGKHFRRRKRKGKERKHFGRRKRKGKERKHFRGRNGRERRGNISEGEMERKGKERKHFTEKKEGKKIRKEEKACRGSRSDAAGCGQISFCYFRGQAYWGMIGGIVCGVRVNG